MKMRIVPVKVIETAIQSTQELSELLQKMQGALAVDQGPKEAFYINLAEMVENGEIIEDILAEVERGILTTLIERGHNTSRTLANVIKKTDGATRRLLSYQKISIKETRV